ncbi:transcriptional regulator [Ignicoccus pacificus DSM 13166]|uniref:Transcriptional regulator n=1 Tax=Ignicoccus pacificus DSM 13166 TaxID=940294 RepID=A0A977K939_9CREN|nr:transcriptional regulator [Ignicoccus pacificus DSM 13166]
MDPKREFWKGTYYLLILKMIKESGTSYGYELRKALKELKPSESTIYDTLKKLEKGGYVKGEWVKVKGRARKRYQLTERGEELLRELEEEARLLCSFLTGPRK